MQKQKIRGMVLAAVVCCVSLSGCGAAEKNGTADRFAGYYHRQ